MSMKKAQVLDITYSLIYIVLVCVSTIIAFIIFQYFDAAMVANGLTTEVYNKTAANAVEMFTFFDLLMPLALVLSIASVVISSFFIETHPAFFIISVFISIFVLITTAMVGNFFQMFLVQTEALAGTSSSFPWMVWISENLMIFATVGAVLTIIALYAKIRGSEGGTF